jgi:hypothetical protein
VTEGKTKSHPHSHPSLRGALQQVQDKLRDVAIPNLRLGDRVAPEPALSVVEGGARDDRP